MESQNNYKQYFAILRAFNEEREITFKGMKVVKIHFSSIQVMKGKCFMMLKVLREGKPEFILGDIRKIQISNE